MVNFPGTRSTPVIVDELGYLLSGLGKVFCFNTENGEEVWSIDIMNEYDGKEIRFGITENLLIDGDRIYCTPGGEDANIIALNRFDGELIWKSKGNGEPSAYCSPSFIEVDGKRFIITITAQSILSIDPENGKMLWSHDLEYPNGIHGNIPIYDNGFLFAMNGWEYGSVMMKISENGNGIEEVWKSHLFDLEHGSALKIGNNIYGTDYTTKQFCCVDWETGEIKKTVKKIAPGTIFSADGLIYCFTYAGEMALVKPTEEGFEIISSFQTPGIKRDHIAHPVIHNGHLYVRYNNILSVYSIKNI